ncbi:hypothetical protein [Listeria valentina]|uniref:hypothetical protein n=1 Tax=Listeria valentina TaxID=2705293 RepID=UPI00142F4BF3|nr:hypothetical protein [Listeria valentina]
MSFSSEQILHAQEICRIFEFENSYEDAANTEIIHVELFINTDRTNCTISICKDVKRYYENKKKPFEIKEYWLFQHHPKLMLAKRDYMKNQPLERNIPRFITQVYDLLFPKQK